MDFGIYNERGEGLGTVVAESSEDAVNIFKAINPSYENETLWAEELNA